MTKRSSFAVFAAAAALIATGAANPAPIEPTAREAFDHVSINVADFDAALRWYQEKLGFEQEVAWRVQALNGKRLAYLTLGGARIELVEADVGAALSPEAKTFGEHFGRTGYGHLCLSVDDVDAMLASLAAKDVPTFVRAETYPLDGTSYERRVGFIKDNDGNVIEFAEPLRKRTFEAR
jgi:catechol 2,3-dioxygenase-like lactoylglutathione lyase family enzyme